MASLLATFRGVGEERECGQRGEVVWVYFGNAEIRA